MKNWPPAPPKPRVKIDRKVRALIWDKSKGHCSYCGVNINPFRNGSTDHVFPVGQLPADQDNHIDNLMLCCRRCNTIKNNKTLEEFRTWLANKRYVKNTDILFAFEKNPQWALKGIPDANRTEI